MGGVTGFTLWYDCNKDDKKTFDELVQGLTDALTSECPFLAKDSCQKLPDKCPVNPQPGVTLPPCEGSTTTTSPGITTTTSPGGTITTSPGPTGTTSNTGCSGTPKDIFIAIDASESVKDYYVDDKKHNDGWNKMKEFVINLIDKLMGTANNHRINVHYFNGITKPFSPLAVDDADPTSVVAHLGDEEQQRKENCETNGRACYVEDANNIGTFVEVDRVDKIKTNIAEFDYDLWKYKATDHIQVYETARVAFDLRSDDSRKAILLLITDGETHKGYGCKWLRNNWETEKDRVTAKIGQCGPDDVCFRSPTSGQTSCDPEKCMCGMLKTVKWREDNPEYTLAIVGIKNGNHGDFEAQMEMMAKYNEPKGELFYNPGLGYLAGLEDTVADNLCSK
jgi:hypothetical protein